MMPVVSEATIRLHVHTVSCTLLSPRYTLQTYTLYWWHYIWLWAISIRLATYYLSLLSLPGELAVMLQRWMQESKGNPIADCMLAILKKWNKLTAAAGTKHFANGRPSLNLPRPPSVAHCKIAPSDYEPVHKNGRSILGLFSIRALFKFIFGIISLSHIFLLSALVSLLMA